MAVNLEKDWPVVAAVAIGVLTLILLSRRSSALQPVVVGGGGTAGAEAAIAAQAQISQAQLAAQTAAFQTYVTEFGATERTKVEAAAAIETTRLKTAAERQKAEYGIIGSIIAGIFERFSWETTNDAVRRRRAANSRLALAYGR